MGGEGGGEGGEGEEEGEGGGGGGGGGGAAGQRGAAASAHLLGVEAQKEGGGGDGGGGPASPTTQYAQLLEGGAAIRYRGDYEFAGRWCASLPRSGGSFTERRGRPEPHLHRSRALPSGKPWLVPGGFSDLEDREAALMQRRWRLAQASTKLALDNRLAKEALNRASFDYAIHQAEKLLPEVRARNRATKPDVDRLKQALKKVVAKFDATGGEPSEDKLTVPDMDVQQMLVQETAAEKPAPPEDVRDSLMI